MNTIPLLFLSVALAIAVIALARERRLRLALQALLARLLSRWRRNHAQKNCPPDDRDVESSDERL
jgi:hypothetical protein